MKAFHRNLNPEIEGTGTQSLLKWAISSPSDSSIPQKNKGGVYLFTNAVPSHSQGTLNIH